MPLLTDEIRAYIGLESDVQVYREGVEPGAVRRFAQAMMDDDPAYDPARVAGHHGGPVAPPLFPASMARRPLGTPDPLTENATDPNFDGSLGFGSEGLPELPVTLATLNGGLEVELFRYARHGEVVTCRSRYADIREHVSKGRAMLFVDTIAEYRTADGELLLRVRRTMIRR